mmetsp:Transcript_32563/g.84386  ORF Transcript_32563/g.84386 Transcript_32563/m.84386 type:complete len:377 (+) Transcript_32563:115-1245(+)
MSRCFVLQEALRRGVSGCRAAFRCVTCGAFSRERHAQGIFTHNGDEPYVRTSGAQLFEAGNKGVQSHMRKEIVKEDEKRNHQVGGHVGAFKDHGNKIHKLVMDAPELAFYRKITEAAAAGDAPRAWPAPFSAAFHGTVHDENGAESMVLENLLAGYRCPCVMDLKMGTRTAQDDARMFKALKMQARDEVSGAASMGVQLIAMSVYRPGESAYYKMSKMKGYVVTATVPLEQILGFFMSNGSRINNSLLSAFRSKVQALLQAFQENKTYQFIGSSLLFTYEGDPAKGAKVACDMRMIDFGHAVECPQAAEAGDPYYQTGLQSILAALDKLETANHLQATRMRHVIAASVGRRWKHKADRGRKAGKALMPAEAPPPAI